MHLPPTMQTSCDIARLHIDRRGALVGVVKTRRPNACYRALGPYGYPAREKPRLSGHSEACSALGRRCRRRSDVVDDASPVGDGRGERQHGPSVHWRQERSDSRDGTHECSHTVWCNELVPTRSSPRKVPAWGPKTFARSCKWRTSILGRWRVQRCGQPLRDRQVARDDLGASAWMDGLPASNRTFGGRRVAAGHRYSAASAARSC